MLGSKLDHRTALWKVLCEKEVELVAALGGDPSPQERIIIADTVRTMLYTSTLDEYLIKLDGNIVKGNKVISVVESRTQLAAHLRRNLEALGLQRRQKVATLTEILSRENDSAESDSDKDGKGVDSHNQP
jgi:hypothetical protein